MHLLYLDDSGSAQNQNEEYLVLGGVSVFEPQARRLTQELDLLAQNICPDNPHDVEFHASEIFSRRINPWNQMQRPEAQEVIKDVLRILPESYDDARVFACAVHKASFPDDDPMKLAFVNLCNEFDLYLTRLRNKDDPQQGLIILDKSSHETTLQRMARDFRTLGVHRNFADTPFFVDSRASRIVQFADHVAYAVFRRYNAKDTQYFDVIASKFDQEEGIVHGLSHEQKIDPNCMCPACITRRLKSNPRRLPPVKLYP